MHNMFSISGDWPKAAQKPRRSSTSTRCSWPARSPSCARAPARRSTSRARCRRSSTSGEDLLYQYLKLEKKIAAGANMAITQVGWDARKFVELKRYLDERGIKTPLLGNVYVLSRRAAERMDTGNPPGCWASPALVGRCAPRAPEAMADCSARLERAAQHRRDPQGLRLRRRLHRRHARRRSHRVDHPPREELAPNVGGVRRGVRFGEKDGFYLYERRPQPKPTRTFLSAVIDARRHASAGGRTTPRLRRSARARRAVVAGSAAPRSLPARALRVTVKKEVFGCQNCGNCVLGSPGVRLPADLSQADAQRPVRRHRPRPLRGHRSAVHLGEGDGARRGLGPGRELKP